MAWLRLHSGPTPFRDEISVRPRYLDYHSCRLYGMPGPRGRVGAHGLAVAHVLPDRIRRLLNQPASSAKDAPKREFCQVINAPSSELRLTLVCRFVAAPGRYRIAPVEPSRLSKSCPRRASRLPTLERRPRR